MFYFFHKLFKILFFFDSAFYDFTHLSKTVVKKSINETLTTLTNCAVQQKFTV